MSGFSSSDGLGRIGLIADSTIVGNNAGSTGAALALTAAQAAAIIGAVGGALKSVLVSTSFDLTSANGTVQNVTGAGFNPTVAVIIASKAGTTAFSIGAISTTGAQFVVNMVSDAATWSAVTNFAVSYANAAASVFQLGAAAFISDGISLTYTKSGSPSGTLDQRVVFLR